MWDTESVFRRLRRLMMLPGSLYAWARSKMTYPTLEEPSSHWSAETMQAGRGQRLLQAASAVSVFWHYRGKPKVCWLPVHSAVCVLRGAFTGSDVSGSRASGTEVVMNQLQTAGSGASKNMSYTRNLFRFGPMDVSFPIKHASLLKSIELSIHSCSAI